MKKFIKIYPFIAILSGVIGFAIVFSLPGQQIELSIISGLLFGNGIGLLLGRLIVRANA